MPRSRVLSFMSQWGSPSAPRSPDPNSGSFTDTTSPSSSGPAYLRKSPPPDIDIAQAASLRLDAAMREGTSPTTHSRSRGDLKPKRTSMLQSYVPPQVDVARDTPPELQPIFTYLNSHSNKLYQEGYFLKLHDLDSRGRPSAGRVWTECFAQLIGTVLSLWDAAALDAAGEDAEVVPTFINLSDASIKMIESLPMNGAQGGNLQNVLSVSTAANNRYLLHFNTLSSLTQWTAGIRLAMFEHATLQEAYTGSLIAGKGRYLNNIKQIMFRLKFPHEDWVRVRFGAGTPWQRCWCVISPPEEKSWEKAQKAAKKAGPYERVKYPKGDIKFYDTRKINKKTLPIATITDAFAAYAVYPQSKPLIEQSTLLKIEGLVNVHDSKDETTEGFVFVMPEVHQAVTGFEMMLRWLFPAYDTFSLYGRPQKLIADTLDQRGLMFAMPTNRRYGYLDILDVSALIHTKGSQGWSERQWRRELKKLTSERMTQQLESNVAADPRRRNTADRLGVRFGDGEVSRSTPGSRSVSPAVQPGDHSAAIPRTNTAPPNAMGNGFSPHKRAASEAQGYRRYQAETPSRLSQDATRPDSSDGFAPPPPPPHMGAPGGVGRSFTPGSLERIHSGSSVPTLATAGAAQVMPNGHQHIAPVEPVGPPPAFTHLPNSRPANQPYAAPELRRANSTVDAETLAEMQDAVTPQPYYDGGLEPWSGEVQHRQQNMVVSPPTLAHNNARGTTNPFQGAVNSVQAQPMRDPRQRLSTIPGSPYVSEDMAALRSRHEATTTLRRDGEQSPTRSSQPPPVPMKNESQTATGSLQSTRSIARKPVPAVPPPWMLQRSSTDPTQPPSIAGVNGPATSTYSVPVNDYAGARRTRPTNYEERRRSRSMDGLMGMHSEASRGGQANLSSNELRREYSFEQTGPSSSIPTQRYTAWNPAASAAFQQSRSNLTPDQMAQMGAQRAHQAHQSAREQLVQEPAARSRSTGRRKLMKERPLSRNLSSPDGERSYSSMTPPPQQQARAAPPAAWTQNAPPYSYQQQAYGSSWQQQQQQQQQYGIR